MKTIRSTEMSTISIIAFLFAVSSMTSAERQSFEGGNFIVEWTHLPASQQIEFNLTVKTTAWVGLGISKENSAMKKLDVYAGGNKAGKSEMKDYYVDGTSAPQEDTKQDVTNIATSESGGFTHVSFRRLLDTGDAKDNKITAGEQYFLAWAYGSTDTFAYHHNNRGYSSLVTLVALPQSTTAVVTPSSTIAPTPASSSVASSSVAPTTTTLPGQDVKLSFKKGDYKLNWSFDSNTKEITFQITIKGIGWIGLGISDLNSPAMKDMDVAVAMVKSSGHGMMEDYYSTKTTTPAIDAKQDFTLVKASQASGKTMVVFKRKLKTNDDKDVEIVIGKSYYVAWAYSPTSRTFGYHKSDRGYSSTKVILVASTACVKLSHILLMLSLFSAIFGR